MNMFQAAPVWINNLIISAYEHLISAYHISAFV